MLYYANKPKMSERGIMGTSMRPVPKGNQKGIVAVENKIPVTEIPTSNQINV